MLMRHLSWFFGEGISPAGWFILGNAFWVVAYILTVIRGFRVRSYGVPLVAICLNFSWELCFAGNCFPLHFGPNDCCVCPAENLMSQVLLWAWLGIDAVVVAQAMVYGGSLQTSDVFRRWLPLWLVAGISYCYVGHLCFITFFSDVMGTVDAWLINAVMSLLFVYWVLTNADLRGLSGGAAWTKMIGSACNAVGLLVQQKAVNGTACGQTRGALMNFLFLSVFCLDLAYVILLWRAHRLTPATGSAAKNPSFSGAANQVVL